MFRAWNYNYRPIHNSMSWKGFNFLWRLFPPLENVYKVSYVYNMLPYYQPLDVNIVICYSINFGLCFWLFSKLFVTLRKNYAKKKTIFGVDEMDFLRYLQCYSIVFFGIYLLHHMLLYMISFWNGFLIFFIIKNFIFWLLPYSLLSLLLGKYVLWRLKGGMVWKVSRVRDGGEKLYKYLSRREKKEMQVEVCDYQSIRDYSAGCAASIIYIVKVCVFLGILHYMLQCFLPCSALIFLHHYYLFAQVVTGWEKVYVVFVYNLIMLPYRIIDIINLFVYFYSQFVILFTIIFWFCKAHYYYTWPIIMYLRSTYLSKRRVVCVGPARELYLIKE